MRLTRNALLHDKLWGHPPLDYTGEDMPQDDVSLFMEVGRTLISRLEDSIAVHRQERDELSKRITAVQAAIEKLEAKQLSIMQAIEDVDFPTVTTDPPATAAPTSTDDSARRKKSPRKPNTRLLEWVANYTSQYTTWIVQDMARDAAHAGIGDYRTVYKTVSDRLNYMCRSGIAVRTSAGVYKNNGTQ